MFALIGLGNPGEKYLNTRHNIGYLALDEIIKKFENSESINKFSGQLWSDKINKKKIYAFKSNSFMNDSGIAVSKLVTFHKFEPENIYVIHDDLDLDFGKVRIKFAGSAAGHNGLKSIDERIGKNYFRVRIGIGHPGDKDRVLKYVLSNFSKKEIEVMSQICINITTNLDYLISQEHSTFLNKIKII
jgi:PTH1 family peptidyl-tRNA hydrolase